MAAVRGRGARATVSHTLTTPRKIVEHTNVRHHLDHQVRSCGVCAAHGRRVQRMAGTQSLGPYPESLGAYTSWTIRAVAAAGGWRQVHLQGRPDAALRI